MSEAVLALVAAALGAIAAIAGQSLAPIVQSRSAHREWLRDKRAQGCEQFYQALQEARYVAIMQTVLNDSHDKTGRTPIPRATAEDLQAVAGRLTAGADLVELYSSDELGVAAKVTAVRFTLLTGHLLVRQEDSDDPLEVFQDEAAKVDALIKKELKLR